MCLCACVCMYVGICVCIHICVCIRACLCESLCLCVCAAYVCVCVADDALLLLSAASVHVSSIRGIIQA